MRSKGINLEQTKRENRLLVLRLLCTSPVTTRTEIINQIGLAKMTVSNIVAELLRAELVTEVENTEARPTAGRPQTGLKLSVQSPTVLGIWISRDRCMGVQATMGLEILKQHSVPLGPAESAETLMNKLEALAGRLISESGRPIMGVGISCLGPLNLEQGVLVNPPDFYGIQNLPLAKLLSQRLRLPVYLQNDMNASALAEKLFGICAGCENFAYIGITNGIGAGLILKNSLFTGEKGGAGEIGHTVVGEGPLCSCGNRGCLESYLSVPNLLARFRGSFQREFSDVAEICAFCEQDTAGALLLREVLEKLVIALVNLCNIIDPEAVVIGHDGAALTNSQVDFLARGVNSRILARESTKIKILRSSFGALAPVYGAAVTALQPVFDGALWYDELFS